MSSRPSESIAAILLNMFLLNNHSSYRTPVSEVIYTVSGGEGVTLCLYRKLVEYGRFYSTVGATVTLSHYCDQTPV